MIRNNAGNDSALSLVRRVLTADDLSLLLRHIGGESQAAIGETMERSQSCISKRLARIAAKLRAAKLPIRMPGRGRPRTGAATPRSPDAINQLFASERSGSVNIARRRWPHIDEESN